MVLLLCSIDKSFHLRAYEVDFFQVGDSLVHPLMCFPLKFLQLGCLKHYLFFYCGSKCFISGFPGFQCLDPLSGLLSLLIDLPIVSRLVSQYFFSDDRLLHVILEHFISFRKCCVLCH